MGNRKSTKDPKDRAEAQAKGKLALRLKSAMADPAVVEGPVIYEVPGVTPRRVTALNDRQKRFAEFYVFHGMKPQQAYEHAYGPQSKDIVAKESAYRLLRHVGVQEYVDKLRVSLLDKSELNALWVVERWKLLYFACVKKQDSTGAARALIEIGKVLGIYEKHNRQKVQYSQSDVERLKQELTEAGFDLSRLDPSEN